MAENPAEWPEAEKIIAREIDEYTSLPEGFCGLTLPKRIADALRQAGLLREEVK